MESLQQCPLCQTVINQGAVVCTGCGATKRKFMPQGEAFGLRFLVAIAVVLTLFAHMWGSVGSANASLLLVPATVLFSLFRYATRKYYWIKD